jgi:hypothetical protein
MKASGPMAKARLAEGSTPEYFATVSYKQWVWKEIRKRSGVARGDGAGALQWLVDEMKRRASRELIEIGKLESLQTGTLSMFLGKEEKVLPPSNTTLMPAINKALRIAPPPICDPTDDLAQVRDLFADRWRKMEPGVQRAILELLGKDAE